MATYNKFNQFVEDLAHGVHNFNTAVIKYGLCATASAPVATNSVLADLTVISYTNLTDDGTGGPPGEIGSPTSEGSDGSYELVLTDLTITASGGAIAAFQYIVIYNDTPTSPADPLIAWFDYGSALTLNTGESLLIDFAANFLTIQ